MAYSTEKLARFRPKYRKQLAESLEWLDTYGVSAQRGYKADSLIDALRYEAIAAYVLDGDGECFRARLAECVRVKAELFEAKSRGDDIELHLVSLYDYGFVYYGYAAKAPDLSHRLALLLAGETRDACINCVAIGLRHFLQTDRSAAAGMVEKALSLTIGSIFTAYTNALKAIIDKRHDCFVDCMNAVVAAHQRECRLRFSSIVDTEEELLSSWGIGLANLGAEHGLSLAGFSSDVIPADLLQP